MYWFYQYKAMIGKSSTQSHDQESAKIAGRKTVHIKPFSRSCLRYQNSEVVLARLLEQYPDLRNESEAYFETNIDEVRRNVLAHYGWNLGGAEIQIKKILRRNYLQDHLSKIGALDGITCAVSGHLAIVYDKDPTIGLKSASQTEHDGLYM